MTRPDKLLSEVVADQRIDYLTIGHISVDALEGHRRVLGGSVLYAGKTARNLGASVAIHTCCAREEGLAESLAGIVLHQMPSRYSTTYKINYDAAGRRQEVITQLAEPLALADVPVALRHPRIVHLAPEYRELDSSFAAAFPGAFVGVTPQGWMRQRGSKGEISRIPWATAAEVFPHATAIVVSEEDLADPNMTAWDPGSATLVVTRAARGCDVYAADARRAYHSPALRPSRLVDPTGAGDVFAAAYFWRLHQTADPFESADWANCVASFAVEHHGASGIPTLEAVHERWVNGTRLD